ncbi:MAG: lamin tail domain-containing protein, partial [Limisphaerales bacterium]
MERAFEFNDGGGLSADPEPSLQRFTSTGGVKKREHYRWNFMFRSTDRRDDYNNIFALVDAVNASAPEPYTSATLGLVDMEEWMGIFATEHIIENFDAYGHEIGKNMYAYLPPSGRWQLYLFDLDWAMLAAPRYSSQYTASNGPLFNADDPAITRMYGFAPFVRAYWRTVQKAVDGPLDPANCNQLIDTKSRALFANGIRWCDGQALTEPSAVKTWFAQRRAALQGQLATVAAPFAVGSVTVSNNVAIIAGTAPIGVATLSFNGGQWPLAWTSVNGWTATVPLQLGNNQWTVLGLDTQGQPVLGASNTVSAVYSGLVVTPVGQVVINEIMYSPLVPGGEYIELYNNSTTLSFDLSGWKVNGLSYTFPAGALIGPNQFLVLAANRADFAAAYGSTNLVFDTYSGKLQGNGETLTLLDPGTNGAPDLVVSKVRYSSAAPWPSQADGTGNSLQLIDPHQDNWRVGNWTAALPTPGSVNNGATALPVFPSLWVNEVEADNLTGITNGLGQRAGWVELYNPGSNSVSLSGLYLSTNYSNLTGWSFPAGALIRPGQFLTIFADAQASVSTTNELHANFMPGGGSGGLALSRVYQSQPQVLDYLDYTNLPPDYSYGSLPDGQSFDRQEFALATPGAPNGSAHLA